MTILLEIFFLKIIRQRCLKEAREGGPFVCSGDEVRYVSVDVCSSVGKGVTTYISLKTTSFRLN